MTRRFAALVARFCDPGFGGDDRDRRRAADDDDRCGRGRAGTIVIRDGRIVALGADVAGHPLRCARHRRARRGRRQVSSRPTARWGRSRSVQVPASADRATHSAAISAGFDISLGLNPDLSILLPVSRLAGITYAVTTPL